MQQQEGYKKFLPHLLIIGIFLAISCAFCYPQFQGKTLAQHDINQWLWASRESREFHAETGQSALWANNMFSGMPTVSIDSYSENNWFRQLNMLLQLNDHGKTMPNPAVYFFLAMCSFYILMLTLKANRWLGLIGAVAFAFSTYNPTIFTAGHITKFMDLVYIPAILAGMILAYRGKYFAGAALSGLFFALFFDSNHLQIIYYSIFLFFIFIVAKFVDALRKKELKKWFFASVLIGAGAIFAFLASSSSIIQMREFAPSSMRGQGGSELTIGGKQKGGGLNKDYAFSWSNGVGECFSILVPNLYGGSIDENIGTNSNLGKKLSDLGQPDEVIEGMTTHANLYWGPQPLLTGSAYFGAVICLLFVLALFIIRSNMKWWLTGAALLFICFSMGKNFPALNYFMFDHFPLFNSFRSPNMAISLASIIFPMLGIWALRDIFEEKISKEELLKKLKHSLIITGGLCVIILIATQTMMDYKSMGDDRMIQGYGQAGSDIVKAIREDRQSAATMDTMRSLLFILLAGGALWAYGKSKINKNQAILALGILVAIDLIPVAHRWLNEDKFRDTEEYMAENFEPSPADAEILRDKEYYRVLDLTTDPFSNSKPSYFHNALGGYSAAKLQIYQDLIENQLSKYNIPVLNMLNTKYFIFPTKEGTGMMQPNPSALGNAWFVADIKWVKTADEEMLALNGPGLQNPADTTTGNFNPAQTAVVRDTFKSVVGNYNFGKDSAAYIRLVPGGYSPRSLKYESNNTQPGVAVFSDIYYPTGWTATIDGKEAPVFKANYVLRAMKIPAGKHTVEFQFHSKAFETGKKMALAGSILLSLLIASGIYFSFFAKNKDQHDAPGTVPEKR